MPVGVIAESDHVGAGVEDLGGRLLGDPYTTGGVLAVDDDQVGAVLGTQLGHRRRQPCATGLADDVPYEKETHQAAERRRR